MDWKEASTILGVLGALSATAGTWAVMQHRIEQTEARVRRLESRVDDLSTALTTASDEVRCLICDAHAIPCPGC